MYTGLHVKCPLFLSDLMVAFRNFANVPKNTPGYVTFKFVL